MNFFDDWGRFGSVSTSKPQKSSPSACTLIQVTDRHVSHEQCTCKECVDGCPHVDARWRGSVLGVPGVSQRWSDCNRLFSGHFSAECRLLAFVSFQMVRDRTIRWAFFRSTKMSPFATSVQLARTHYPPFNTQSRAGYLCGSYKIVLRIRTFR